MITLVPTYAVRKKYKTIDFKLLSYIFSMTVDAVRKKQYDVTIKINLIKGPNSLFYWRQATAPSHVTIHMTEDIISDTHFVMDLIHEFRHFMQENIMGIRYTKNTHVAEPFEEYIKCAVEVDARMFCATTGKRMFRLYQKMIRFKVLSSSKKLLN